MDILLEKLMDFIEAVETPAVVEALLKLMGQTSDANVLTALMFWLTLKVDQIYGILYNFFKDPMVERVLWIAAAVYVVVLVVTVLACFMGATSRYINYLKGRKGGFAWGLFLGWIGIVVVASRPALEQNVNDDEETARAVNAKVLMATDSEMWFCPSCGYPHPSTDTECACGIRKKV